jgi:hypothetical protein
MRHTRPILLLATLALLPLGPLAGCEDKKKTTPAAASGSGPKADDHGHDHAADGSHAKPAASAPGHGGGVIDLGAADTGPFHAKATRDKGDVVAGKDAAFDVTITPKDAAGAKVATVRFWIGTQDGKGSVKAKAEVEDPKDPNRWHTHAEVPNPIPERSMFWFEIEDDKGGKHVGSFDLKK